MSVVEEPRRTVSRSAFEAVAHLFRYPDEFTPLLAEDACWMVGESSDEAAKELRNFVEEISALDRSDRQSTYTSTFDLAPSCSPYLGTHLFAEDSRDRALLMVGLRTSVRNAGAAFDARELPDHVAEVLRFASRYRDDEWSDLGRLVILPALRKMETILASTSNPYRHLLTAARLLAAAAFVEGGNA